ncbi:MAG: tetratricopeptide repeat protein [Pseudomonadota bacterium]
MPQIRPRLPLLTIAATLALALAGAAAHGARPKEDCGPLQNAYGPFDYLNPDHVAKKLDRVERAHFDKGVENLKGHLTNPGGKAQLKGDIAYTLRAFPNHHRALYAMVRLHIQNKGQPGRLMQYSADCWFDRAIRFKPDDGTVYMLYGLYLTRMDDYDDALVQYRYAENYLPESAEVAYNMGLLFAETKDYDEAREYAEKAYRLGYPLPGLRNKLKRAGAWKPAQQAAATPD